MTKTNKAVVLSLLIFSLIISVVFTILFFCNRSFSYNNPVDNEAFGQFGDIIGGVVGTIVSLVSFFLLYETLKQQATQFSKQEKDNQLSFSRQQIENRFFELLKIHRENSNTISINNRESRKVYLSLERELILTYAIIQNHQKESTTKLPLSDLLNIAYTCFFYGSVGVKSRDIIRLALRKYDQNYIDDLLLTFQLQQDSNEAADNFDYKVFEGHQSRLGHYFRHLYQTVKYINKIDKSILDYDNKRYYISTLRAQFTTQEQFLLMWNALSDMGKSWENGKDPNSDLITKYNLIKNIPTGYSRIFEAKTMFPNVHFESDIEPEHRKELKKQYI